MARIHHKAKTTARGLGWEWQKFRKRILKRDLYMCQPCKREGRATPATEVDHILARHKGGEMTDGNAESICTPCHKAKTAAEQGHKRPREVGSDGYPV